MSSCLAWFLLLSPAALAQESREGLVAPPTVDPHKVDSAIEQGVAFLKAHSEKLGGHKVGKRYCRSDDLVVLTLVHAGVPESDPMVQKLLQTMLETPIERTYNASLQAMVLEEIHRVKYQRRIAQCAQFLVDNQCQNGQWSYGDPTEAVNTIPTGGAQPAVASGGVRVFEPATSAGPRVKPKVLKRIPVRKTKDGPGQGDNSNSQYAALGLRACHDAGVVIPKDVILLAQKWWLESMHEADADKKDGRPAVATGGLAVPRGWCYKEKDSHNAYGSMTAGAVGALVIYDYLLDRKWQNSTAVRSGMSWMAQNFTVTANPGPAETFRKKDNTQLYYYLYAMERLGMLYGTATIGRYAWYEEGAKVILEQQKPDGSWHASDGLNEIWDTCFAILILKRSTRPLVASVDKFAGEKK